MTKKFKKNKKNINNKAAKRALRKKRQRRLKSANSFLVNVDYTVMLNDFIEIITSIFDFIYELFI